MKNCILPLITVIVPIYNGEKFLVKCIDSIIQQNYKKLEIILINDGSTDNSGSIADGYVAKDHRVKTLHKENAGVSVARNMAMDMSAGKYICFIDQDDYIAPDYISYLYGIIKQTGAEISITPTVNKFTDEMYKITPNSKIDKIEVWSGQHAAIENLYYNIIVAPWNKMFSRDLIMKNNLRFNPRFFPGEGFNFSVDCFQCAGCVGVGHKKVYFYRLDNPDSGMTKFNMQMASRGLEAVMHIKENLLQETPDLIHACAYANWHTHCDFLNTIIGSGAVKIYPEVYKQLRSTSRAQALCALSAPISVKEKCKGVLYLFNPVLAAKIINCLRLRKFTKY